MAQYYILEKSQMGELSLCYNLYFSLLLMSLRYVKEHDYEIHEFLGPINTDTRVFSGDKAEIVLFAFLFR